MKTRNPAALLVIWALTRALLLLCVFKVVVVPGPDVTSDVSVIYQGWFDILRTGTFPLDDVTWQYPPVAAVAILSPALLPFLSYTSAFFLMAFLADAVVFLMLLYVERRGMARRGVWVWVVGLPLLGQTVYARYDVMVVAVAVAALLAAARHPKASGVMAALGAMLKVWPALLLVGVGRGRATRESWGAAALTAGGLALTFAVAMPGAFAFLTFQRDRGTEVESLGSLVFHVARRFGWSGTVQLNYGSVEFLGPYVDVVSVLAQGLTVLAFGWLVLWRIRARAWVSGTQADAALTAVLLFTTTSRVISPQYMLWLVGLAAVCLLFRDSRMALPVWLVLAATFVTFLEFPLYFSHVVASDTLGLTLLLVRNGLLVAATLSACRRLWRATVTEPRHAARVPAPPHPVRAGFSEAANSS
ncbi:glycosyltransferase 87 family protein [Streptomyces kunmingensis]|uniref:Glycosyltransferase 87 family protein n=1 Tax=Streptomyces kunmingensis TaxID=68225 RepID=A0ABU6C977_9ACTN|nr:glycosyltransferase 87 family protein [Streptomyces kunmingensis]MEB3961183.1 glycosyltransferase 87 family protein [Streptomyces kunmingensis]